jgi:hypothetical protein
MRGSIHGKRQRRKLSLPTEEPLDCGPCFAKRPFRRACEEQDGNNRGQVGQKIDTEEIHRAPLQNETHAASAATT